MHNVLVHALLDLYIINHTESTVAGLITVCVVNHQNVVECIVDRNVVSISMVNSREIIVSFFIINGQKTHTERERERERERETERETDRQTDRQEEEGIGEGEKRYIVCVNCVCTCVYMKEFKSLSED